MTEVDVPERLRSFLDEFRLITDRDMQAELLIEYGERFREVPEHIATRPFPETAKVPACESEAYVFTEMLEGGSLRFHFAVENPQGISAKAMAAIIDETLSGAPLEQITKVPEDLVYEIFGRGISMGKGIGLKSMIGVVRALAENELKRRSAAGQVL